MFHNSQAVLALSREENPTVFQKTLGLNDFYFGSDDFDYPLGQHPDGRQVTGADVPRREARRDQAGARVDARASRQARDRLLALDRGPADAREPRDGGQATASSRSRYTPTNDDADEAAATSKLKSMLGKLDMNADHLLQRFAYMKNEIPVAGVAHQAGTCRFGTDPATSVLNVDCRAHELDNLYVVDTSFFPSIGAVNPALTAMANSLRVGDHLLDRLS